MWDKHALLRTAFVCVSVDPHSFQSGLWERTKFIGFEKLELLNRDCHQNRRNFRDYDRANRTKVASEVGQMLTVSSRKQAWICDWARLASLLKLN
jgi:hypothetical protein